MVGLSVAWSSIQTAITKSSSRRQAVDFTALTEARILKRLPAMLLSLAVAATVLASPPPLEIASQLPKGAVFLVLAPTDGQAVAGLRRPSASADSPPEAFLGGVLAQLAVVKPHRSEQGATPSLQLFVLVAPMGDRLGFRAFGSF